MFAHRGFSKLETQHLVDGYPVNKIIAVYFDPKNPQSAVLEPGVQWLLILALAFAIFLTVVMVWIAYADLRGQLPSQQGHPLHVPSPEHAIAQPYQYRGVILFVVALSFAVMFFIVLLPDAPLWPMVVTIGFAVLVLLYQLFR
jgi:phosphatidylglycerophosphate synthase